MKSKSEIVASTQRMASGWAAVLEFPNGGRQVFSSRHGSMDDALLEARHGLKCRLEMPQGAVPDPEPNRLMILEDRSTWGRGHGAAVETQMAIRHPNCI